METTSSREKYLSGKKPTPYALIPYKDLLTAWQEFIAASGQTDKAEFDTTKGRSTFLRTFFHELPFVERYQRGRSISIRLKEFALAELPQVNLQSVLTLLGEVVKQEMTSDKMIRRCKEGAKEWHGLQVLGFLNTACEVEETLWQEYRETEQREALLARQIQQEPYLSVIYQLLFLTDGFSKEERLSLLQEVGLLLVRTVTQEEEALVKSGTQNILNWLQGLGLVDDQWETVKKQS